MHISRIVVKPFAQNLHIGQWRPWLCHNGRRIQGSLCNYFFAQTPCIMSKQLCVHTIYLALRVMGSDKEQKRAQDDCNFGYFSTRLALLWHEALAIPLIQVIFWSTCPSSFDGPHLFLGNNEQRAKKQRPGAGGTIFCQNILRTTHSEGKIIGLNSSRFYNLETSSNFDALRRCNDSK